MSKWDDAIESLKMSLELTLFDPMSGEVYELCELSKENQAFYHAAELAIEALREAAEREKGCWFCCYTEYPDKTFYPKEGYSFYAGFSKQTAVDDFHEGEIENFDFCPNCGRKLTKEPDA